MMRAADPTPTSNAEVVTILGACGGCGASTLAASVAWLLSTGHPTLLVDLDDQRGMLRSLLDLRSVQSVNDSFLPSGLLDPNRLSIATHELSPTLRVLSQPDDLEELRRLSVQDVDALLTAARAQVRWTVLDAGSQIRGASLAAARGADRILLVVRPEVIAIREARRTLKLLRSLGTRDRVQLILSDVGHREEVSAEDVTHVLKTPVAAHLPHQSRQVQRSEATAAPFAAQYPQAPWTRALSELVQTWTPDLPSLQSGGWWSPKTRTA